MILSYKHSLVYSFIPQDYKDKISELEIQRNELIQTLKMKRGELHKRKEEVETEDEVLQKLINSVSKNKSELQHIFEMQKIEKHELDSLKSQHAQKLSELEKTQRELLEVKILQYELHIDLLVNKEICQKLNFELLIV